MVRSIINLPKIVGSLSKADRELFDRIYRYYIEVGRLKLPNGIRETALRKFGECEEQTIVRITNKITLESTLFNELRAKRPIEAKSRCVDHPSAECRFCRAEELTAEDVFGRIEGKHCITASNMAKYDYLHAIIIFRDHEPFVFEEEKILDYLDVAWRWVEKANEFDESARYPFFMWNCLWRAGASIIHGHAQILLSKEPYAMQEFYDSVRKAYRREFGSEYFDDFFRVHESLGLGFELEDVRIMVYLTPIKEKEVLMLAKDFLDLPNALSKILRWYYGIGVRSFNLAVFLPPIGENDLCLARIVDRGNLENRTCDIGCMELFARTSVVSSDPFKLSESLKKFI